MPKKLNWKKMISDLQEILSAPSFIETIAQIVDNNDITMGGKPPRIYVKFETIDNDIESEEEGNGEEESFEIFRKEEMRLRTQTNKFIEFICPFGLKIEKTVDKWPKRGKEDVLDLDDGSKTMVYVLMLDHDKYLI